MKLASKPLLIFLAFAFVGALIIDGMLRMKNPAPHAVTTGTADIGGPFTLISTSGEVVTDRTYRGSWPLMFFGYTYCPDVCPTALNNISVALNRLGSEASKFRPLFITVDPNRDTRAVMAEYLKSFDSRIVGLTGTPTQIESVVKEYRVYVAQQKTESGDNDYLVDHSGYIYLMDPKGRFVNVIQGGENGEEIATWLRKEIDTLRDQGAVR